MTRWVTGGLVLVAVVFGLAAVPAAEHRDLEATTPVTSGAPHFQAVDVFLDSPTPIAAYQLEVEVAAGDATIVGVEGGAPPLDAPPFYDPAALANDRIILAAFTTSATLPAGRHRVATVHFRELGGPATYQVELTVVGDREGKHGSATASIEARKGTP